MVRVRVRVRVREDGFRERAGTSGSERESETAQRERAVKRGSVP